VTPERVTPNAFPGWPSSLRARLTLWYTVLLGLPLIVLAVGTYLVFSRALEGRTTRFTNDALTAFSRELVAERRATLSAREAIRSTVEEVRFQDLRIAVRDTTGVLVARTDEHDDIAGPTRSFTQPIVVGGERFTLTGTYPIRETQALLSRLRTTFVIAIPLLLLFAATSGFFLAKRSLAPVAAMAAQAAKITESNLHERLPVEGGEELVGLAKVVNELLDRLEQSFAQQRRFVADASHELRTPTAILRAEADVTLARPHREEAEYRASMDVMRDATRRLTRIVDDLFLLARADAGHLVVHMKPVYLDEIVDDAVRGVRSVAEARGLRVELQHLVDSPLQADEDLLGRVLLNLLDNAIKYANPDGLIEVTLTRQSETYVVSVIDSGPGIPLDAQAHVFERFFRVDAARSRSESASEGATSGAGLGLPIARRIAELHGGRLDLVESRAGRTEFRLILAANARSGVA
jgi:heavy metal sensor kinase